MSSYAPKAVDGSNRHPSSNLPPKANVNKKDPRASFPDPLGDYACYELTVIERDAAGSQLTVMEDIAHDTTLFNTGLILSPPPGYKLEIYANDTLYKLGYNFCSPIVIHEPQDMPLKIPIFKYKDTERDLELPMKVGKMYLSPCLKFHINSVVPQGGRDGPRDYDSQSHASMSSGPNRQQQAQKGNFYW